MSKKSSVPEKYLKTHFYHFTHIENLESIIKHGILSTNKKKTLSINHLNIASEGIQERRSEMKITCGPGGTVHDYVPFYLCSVNPMLLSIINSKNVDQPLIIKFVTSLPKIDGIPYVFSDASANTLTPPTFYDDPSDLDKLDWDAIESKKWSCKNEEERHKRMAEVLIYESVPLTMIDKIVVWNDDIKKMVEEIFKQNNVAPPSIVFNGHFTKFKFHFTKFMVKGQEGYSIVTGPHLLKANFKETVENIAENRKNLIPDKEFPFDDIKDALNKIDNDFCAIEELKGIYQLETENDVHKETVSDHTLSVIRNLEKCEFYTVASDNDKNILKLSAYFHDIGKGPKSKWSNGKQPLYPDHPAHSLEMLVRTLSDDIRNLTDYEIRKICLLVTYHDLIGEIFGKGRDKKQLFDIIQDINEFEMLATLNYADVKAIEIAWAWDFKLKLPTLRKEMINKLSEI